MIGQCCQPAHSLNCAGSSGIEKAAANSIIDAELREPSAAPYPVRKKRISQRSKNCSGKANGAKTPAIRAASKWNQGSEAHGKNLQQRGERGIGEPSKESLRKKKGSAAIQFQLFPDKISA